MHTERFRNSMEVAGLDPDDSSDVADYLASDASARVAYTRMLAEQDEAWREEFASRCADPDIEGCWHWIDDVGEDECGFYD